MRLAYALAMRLLCAEMCLDAPLLACDLVETGYVCQTWWNDFWVNRLLKQISSRECFVEYSALAWSVSC